VKLHLFVLISLINALSGCANRNIANKQTGVIYDTGTIVKKTGQMNCHIIIRTDRYGVFTTVKLYIEDCEKYREKNRVQVKIKNNRRIEILELSPE